MTERALVSRAYDFRILPFEMDELDVHAVRAPLRLLFLHDAYLKKGKDLKLLSPEEVETIGELERLKDALAELERERQADAAAAARLMGQ